MYVFPNCDPPRLEPGEEAMFESVVEVIVAELSESLVARGVESIEYSACRGPEGQPVAFEFNPVGRPQVPLAEFERVLAMRFVQILWERFEKRCLPLSAEEEDKKFVPWSGGDPEYVLTRPERSGPAFPQALPEGLAGEDRAAEPAPRNAPCPCGSGKKFKHCCGRRER